MTHAVNLERVRSTIAPLILDFCTAHAGGEFRMIELVRYVQMRAPASPDSPSRILRQLRLEGLVDYRVVNRRQSLYLLMATAATAA